MKTEFISTITRDTLISEDYLDRHDRTVRERKSRSRQVNNDLIEAISKRGGWKHTTTLEEMIASLDSNDLFTENSHQFGKPLPPINGRVAARYLNYTGIYFSTQRESRSGPITIVFNEGFTGKLKGKSYYDHEHTPGKDDKIWIVVPTR